jgi:hypothetical protein
MSKKSLLHILHPPKTATKHVEVAPPITQRERSKSPLIKAKRVKETKKRPSKSPKRLQNLIDSKLVVDNVVLNEIISLREVAVSKKYQTLKETNDLHKYLKSQTKIEHTHCKLTLNSHHHHDK